MNEQDIAAAKEALRRIALQKRRDRSTEQMADISAHIQDVVIELEEFRRARVVFCYLATPFEVGTDRIIAACRKERKRVCVPASRKHDGRYEPAWLEETGSLKKGALGIREPGNAVAVPIGEIDAVIVPGVAFDRKGNRLGHGAGHYDRLLSGKAARAFKVGLAFEFQVFDAVPAGPLDAPMDAIATENGIFRCS